MTDSMGNIDAMCPHCNGNLDKTLRWIRKCPHCGQFVYVLPRVTAPANTLVTEAQLEQFLERRFLASGGTQEGRVSFKGRFAEQRAKAEECFAKERARLAIRFGHQPGNNDVRWGLLNQAPQWTLKQLLKLALAKAEVLKSDRKSRHALECYLKACYLDLIVPTSKSRETGVELPWEFPPWDPKGELAPRLSSPPLLAIEMIEQIDLTPAEVEKLFRERVAPLYTASGKYVVFALYASVQKPLSPTQAWPHIRQDLFGDGA